MLTFVALFVVFVSGVSALGCEKLWVQFENSCYYSNQIPQEDRRAHYRLYRISPMVEDLFFRWPTAQDICKNRGGYLAEIGSKEENDFVKKLAKKVKNFSVWLGGTDSAKEGHWVWASTGKPFTFEDWWRTDEPLRRGDEPDNYKGRQDCLSLSMYDDYDAWLDSECIGDVMGYICEKPAT
ncbi:perlucin-like protein [Mytilus californianus]|uniref:perlucin-like protein n=1 Tax=Mytilus californianus TaxID=6549 RepID=UPI0022465A6D|nr:perlucin-like protein [Mytilus californianus]